MRLQEPFESQLKYATLSYCWGPALPLRTTSKTLADHKDGIPLHNMPQIDALCIIQDSTEDWETESVKMSDIFAYSFITICAAASNSCSESFLKRSIDHSLIVPFQSSLRPEISGEYSIRLERWSEYPEGSDIRFSKWRSRAWVWQEEVMATRALMFGKSMLQFRCQEEIRAEDGHVKSPSLCLRKESTNEWFWSKAISDYSARDITFTRDRLSAISGIAKFMSNAFTEARVPQKYLAGLWLGRSFEKQLRWVCNRPKFSYEMMASLWDKEVYFAPSWSWASRNTGVDFLHFGGSTECQVVAHDLQPAETDATVAVKFGSSITVRGKLRQSPLTPLDGAFSSNADGLHNRWEVDSSEFGHFRFWLDWVPSVEASSERALQNRLQLLSTTWKLDKWRFSASGLLLTPFHWPIKPVYRRVGVFEVSGDLNWLMEAPDSDVTIM
ncbi:uncharacterized protein K452DRAFT_337262 [Aplosporella prunicola CBS 121167]|uniref:Heterokaryon incompatibility domain-containing protein n=1 Tax=Aplosporella prunicola CBS 121167 TaxID=1176127 RepID=A0A6A6BS76_9PEZI|nr:uncharacterized protein K452DRAFT_337262 [Aplosporella prunicola CBS 121167]KAF2146949.1 hypothetical protein K452DRAFT_337262 [Aplosporella prunicola CBS 121167]